nr:fimbrillin family protein [Parabacteroides goldsteinii]
MKTLVLSMISIAATLAAMTACTSEGDPIDEGTKDTPVEIKAKAGVLTIETRAEGPISGITAAIDNIAFVKKEAAENATITWGAETLNPASIAAGGVITFSPTIYYPADETTFAHLVGFHPTKEGMSVSDGKVPFTITGNEDIMYAPVQKGNKATAKAEDDTKYLKPKFEHKLAQLIIKIVGDKAAADAWGTLTSISIQDVEKELELNLNNGELVAKTGTTPTSLPLTLTSGYTYAAIPVTETQVGYSMVLPSNNQRKLFVTTSKYTNKEVEISIPASEDNSRLENVTKAGEAYTITLTFKASEVLATATVEAWVPVTNGSGKVE